MAEDGFSITSKGINEVGARLMAFSEKLSNKIIRDAANEAAVIFKDEAVNNITSTCSNTKVHNLKVKGVYIEIKPGNLAKNIKIKTLKKMKDRSINIEVYLKKKHAYYGIWVERGRSNMAANPYMARAFEAKRGEVPDIFRRKIEQGIQEGGV